MSDYFHESMIAKMVSSNDYQQGYDVGFNSGYKQGKADAIDELIQYYKENYETMKKIENEREPFVFVKNIISRLEQLKEKKE